MILILMQNLLMRLTKIIDKNYFLLSLAFKNDAGMMKV